MLWRSQEPRTCRWPFFCFPRILAVGRGAENCTPTLPTLTLRSLHLWASMRFLGGKVPRQLETLSMSLAVDCMEQIWTKKIVTSVQLYLGFDLVLNPQTSCFLLLAPLVFTQNSGSWMLSLFTT